MSSAIELVPANDERELPQLRFSTEQRRLMLDTFASGCSENEFAALVAIAELRGLNPLTQDCYFVKRYDGQKGREVWSVQASIDSFRSKAEDTGLYAGQDEPEFEYTEDGKTLLLAKVRVYRKDWPRPAVGVARFDEYVQTTKDGKLSRFWARMPHNQLAKCAEALAFRKAFPKRFAKIYTPEEMAQATNHDPQTGEILEGAKVLPLAKAKPRAVVDDKTKAVIDAEIESITDAINDAPSVDVLVEQVRPRMVALFAMATKLPKDVGNSLKQYYVDRRTELEK